MKKFHIFPYFFTISIENRSNKGSFKYHPIIGEGESQAKACNSYKKGV